MSHPRLAVCSWSLRPGGPRELAAALIRLRIPRVQLALVPLLRQPEVWAGAQAVLEEAGIEIVSGMLATIGEDYSTLESIARTGGLRPGGNWPANLALASQTADLAASLGLSLVTFHAGFLPESRTDTQRRVLLDRLRSVADVFASRRIRLGLETGQETAPTLGDVLTELNSDVGTKAQDTPGAGTGVGVNFDPANMILYGKGDPVKSLAELAPYIMQIHLKDARPAAAPGQWGTEVPLGRGAVNWPAFFTAARTLPGAMAINFVIEREAGENREADIAAARDLAAGLI